MTFEPSQLTGIVLAGGRSTRLGSTQSKLITRIDGKKILTRIADALKTVTSELILVGRQNQNDTLSCLVHLFSITRKQRFPAWQDP